MTAQVLRILELIRVADVLDVLLVATLVYPAVVWVRRTQAGLVAAGLSILAALYIGAQLFDLRLTTWLLRGFFAIILVVIVVIFQEELRQLFERLALWGLRRGSLGVAVGTPPHDMLALALSDLARDRIGALVVLPGTQPIGRHVHGGIELDGKISVPLLRSIFDPGSPGHDGAVIVRDDRVARFATHLPLSSDLTQLGGVGTRHAAALGLVELTDAMCLVVSEERGEVSIARDGRLLRRLDPVALPQVIAAFAKRLAPDARNTTSFWRALVREHSLEKVVTLVVVATLWWALVPGARVIERTLEVPVRIVDVPDQLEVKEVEPAQVAVTLSGPTRDFLVGTRNLEVALDGSKIRPGRRKLTVNEADLRYPRVLELVGIEPGAVGLVVAERPQPTQP